MTYVDGIEVHLHDIVVVDFIETIHCYECTENWTELIKHHDIGEVVDVFPQNKKCFLVKILGDSDIKEVRVKRRNARLADFRDLHLLKAK